MRASDSSRGMRAENCCVASRASMLVSACRYLPLTNAKLIAAYSSVVKLASQDGAGDYAVAKRAGVIYTLFSCCCWFSSWCRGIAQRCCAYRARCGVVCEDA